MTPAADPALLGKACAIAAVAHQNQIDKAGEAYILHPLRLMLRAQTADEKIVALLHDVAEDCPDWPLARLAREFPPHIGDALDCLTHRDDEPYGAYIERAAGNRLAARVKLLDLQDNMDMTRLGNIGSHGLERLARYHAAYQTIRAALDKPL